MYSSILILVLIFMSVLHRGDNQENLIIPEECMEIGVCEEIPNYPEAFVKQMITELQSHNVTFNQDVLETPQRRANEDNIDLCESSERLFVPMAAQDTNMEWHVILNDKDKPLQTFRVETCNAESDPCSSLLYFQGGHTAKCEQKFILRNMFALNDRQMVQRFFRIPSCCSCQLDTGV
ncbi:protein spaetzle 5 [Maniola hyperantus]|uniref:protein spaetzle 5 n=1 Tax=Aphantopus hyperantus TaxID=2795564 RepID=UPI00374A1A58